MSASRRSAVAELPIEVVPYGEGALLVRLGERIEPATNARVHALARLLRGSSLAIGEPLPAYASLLVPFDPLAADAAAVEAAVRDALGAAAEIADGWSQDERPPLEIVVRYGGDDGPDLAEVAQRAGLVPAQVIELHASVVYRAYMLGFAPGFGYLGELPAALELPRRATPRPRVPAGSVAIAGRQTAVYPLATPGGWHLIGRTAARLWDLEREPPALITAGRQVRFVPA